MKGSYFLLPMSFEDETKNFYLNLLFSLQIFPDMFIKREIMVLHLHCPNEGCDWSGTNKDLQVYIEKPCIYREMIGEHMILSLNFKEQEN